MKKINETKQMLNDLEDLVSKMDRELDRLRNLSYRYYLKHGSEIGEGVILVNDRLDFHLTKNGDKVVCNVHDSADLNITSNYQIIKQMIKKLNQ